MSLWKPTEKARQRAATGMSPKELCLALWAAEAMALHLGYEELAAMFDGHLAEAADIRERQTYYTVLAQTWRGLLAQREDR